MTTQVLTIPTPPFLFTEIAAKIELMPFACVISDDPLDIDYLRDNIGHYFPSQSFTTEHYSDFPIISAQPLHDKCRVVVARIVMDGFFDFLKQAGRENVTVVALVDGTQEEIQAARFIGLEYIVKSNLAISGSIHHLFCKEKAIV